MTFYMDLDGVLIDTESIIREVLSEVTGRGPFDRKDTYTYNFKEGYGISNKTMDEIWPKVFDRVAPIYPGAVEFVEKVKQFGFKAIGLSHRPGNPAKRTSMVALKLGDIRLDMVIYVEHPNDKLEHLRRPDAAWYIEDNPEYAANAAEILGTFLVTRTHNWQAHDLASYIRVAELDQVFKTVKSCHAK